MGQEKWEKEKYKDREETKIEGWIIFARYFGLWHKPSKGPKKDNEYKIQDESPSSIFVFFLYIFFAHSPFRRVQFTAFMIQYWRFQWSRSTRKILLVSVVSFCGFAFIMHLLIPAAPIPPGLLPDFCLPSKYRGWSISKFASPGATGCVIMTTTTIMIMMVMTIIMVTITLVQFEPNLALVCAPLWA